MDTEIPEEMVEMEGIKKKGAGRVVTFYWLIPLYIYI